jgi:hypothetical protein
MTVRSGHARSVTSPATASLGRVERSTLQELLELLGAERAVGIRLISAAATDWIGDVAQAACENTRPRRLGASSCGGSVAVGHGPLVEPVVLSRHEGSGDLVHGMTDVVTDAGQVRLDPRTSEPAEQVCQLLGTFLPGVGASPRGEREGGDHGEEVNADVHEPGEDQNLLEMVVPDLRRLVPGQDAIAFAHTPGYVGYDHYDDLVAQHAVSHHFVNDGSDVREVQTPWRYVWPSELDLMAKLAGLELTNRWADLDRTPFTGESPSHVSVWRRQQPV